MNTIDDEQIIKARDLYQLLGVEKDASPEKITASYLALEKIYHPSNYSFRLISEKDLRRKQLIFRRLSDAYNILNNPVKKLRYDSFIGNCQQEKKEEIPTLENTAEKVNIPKNHESGISEKKRILEEENYYRILGVSPDASMETISYQFIILERKLNPSRNSFRLLTNQEIKENKEAYGKLTEAYMILKDHSSRQIYNQALKSGKKIPVIQKLKDYYQILGVNIDASDKEIKTCFLELEKKYRPINYSFKLISASELKKIKSIYSDLLEAYQVLGNPKSRSEYDRKIKD